MCDSASVQKGQFKPSYETGLRQSAVRGTGGRRRRLHEKQRVGPVYVLSLLCYLIWEAMMFRSER